MLEVSKTPAESSLLAAGDSVAIEIGGIALALRTTDETFRALLQKRYQAFVKPSACIHSQFEIKLLEHDNGFDAEAELQVKLAGRRWQIQRGDFYAEWDSETGRGHIRQSANPYSADAVLRIVHSLILARQGGFLVHAASAIKNHEAFLFTGVSGAGKTTISRLAPPGATLLSDEISYVKPEGDDYRAFGTPFAGELSVSGENVSAPLSTVFFLEKGQEHRIETMPRAEAIRKLLRNILFFADDAELVDLVFEAAFNFAEKVALRRLVFAPDPRVWDLISPARK